MSKTKKIIKYTAIGFVVSFAAIQLVPYGRDHDNPPVTQDAPWDSPRTRELAQRGCFDCHSNETTWPWYSKVAPVSWLVQADVDEGREHLNFSEWDKPQRDAHEAAEEVEEGKMPLDIYTWTHGEAVFTDAERAELIAGLRASFGEKKDKE